MPILCLKPQRRPSPLGPALPKIHGELSVHMIGWNYSPKTSDPVSALPRLAIDHSPLAMEQRRRKP